MANKNTPILLFSTLYPHAGEPTLGIFVENRVRHLVADTQIQVTVVAPVPWFPFKSRWFGAYGRAASAPHKEQRYGITIYHPRYLVIPKIGMLMTPNFLFRAALKCVQKLLTAGLEFDLIDAHYLYPDGVAASKLAGALEKPFVMTARGSDVTEIALLEKPKKAILTAISQASRTICVSENLRRDLIDLGAKPSQISTLRNGVDLDRFQIQQSTVSLQKKSAGPNKLWVMLYAGWLIPRKRLDLVLEVTKQIPNLKTIIVGDGPLKKHLEATTQKLGIADRVEFLGQKKPEEMASLYRSADILLLPSDREGWPNVLLEAMACGTPVVTRSVGAAPDLITDPVAGRVVDSDKSHDIAVAVRDLMTHYPLRADVRRFAENFGWRETSDAQNEIFTRAIRAFEAIKVKVKL